MTFVQSTSFVLLCCALFLAGCCCRGDILDSVVGGVRGDPKDGLSGGRSHDDDEDTVAVEIGVQGGTKLSDAEAEAVPEDAEIEEDAVVEDDLAEPHGHMDVEEEDDGLGDDMSLEDGDEGGDDDEDEGDMVVVDKEDAQEEEGEGEEEEEEISNLLGIGQPKYAKFTVFIYNYYPTPIRLHWRNSAAGGDDQDWDLLEPDKSRSFTTFQGHEWYAVNPETAEELQTLHMTEEVQSYFFEPKEVRDARDQQLEKEKAIFRKAYREKTGRNWLQTYPRDPVKYHIWDSGEIGRKQYITTDCAFWYNISDPDCTENCEVDMERPEAEEIEIELETLSVEPQVFAVHNVMSPDEADLLVEIVQGHMKRSTVKTSGVVSPDRTSETAWVGHSKGPIFENIFDRIGDILKIERSKLRNSYSAESLQVVHYEVGGQYKAHHDYLDPVLHSENPHVLRGNNRLATFLFYLHAPEEGGHTSFPKSKAGPEGEGVNVLLPKGSAVLFYSMMPDGNLDDLTLHAGTPVIKGEKYIANLWIWEPRFR